ncbi:cytochrome c5 family protein [Aquincola sp. S2]|uniref:Cytochrome c5 family protein n=1 Tax=Pseudaquabacterium terrae TaxID=2732868 RepID=A0ABX2ELU6_9BURK|nr:c-type cytochrome [Aquabacterium terrae]NRF69547.1 cytochrome c5 family protein [Aquabacterium terrae]
MSDAQHSKHQDHAAHDAPHEGPIKTPKQLIVTIVASFVVPVVVIIMLTNFVAFGTKSGAGSDGMSAEAVARRIRPVGSVEVKDVNDPAALKNGDQVFQAQCASCHATGALNAPKLADAAAWGPRLKAGYAGLLQAALKGKGSMPPQGGGEFNDVEIGRAVVYMANQSGASLAEPQPPAAAASVAAGASK